MHTNLHYVVFRQVSAGHYVVLFKPRPWGMLFSPTHVQETPFLHTLSDEWHLFVILQLIYSFCPCLLSVCLDGLDHFLSPLISLTEQIAGCQRLWTVWSFFLISWWWTWAEDWPSVRRRRLSTSSSSTESSFSTTASPNTRRCSAITSLTYTQASPSCLVRDQSAVC